MDAHGPYNTKPVPRLNDPGIPDRLPREAWLQANLDAIRHPGEVSEAIQMYRDRYRLGIAHADDGVSTILNIYKLLGLFEDSIVLIISDHGEYLGEHNVVGHGRSLYSETTHVPMIMKGVHQDTGIVEHSAISTAQLPSMICGQLPESIKEQSIGIFGEVSKKLPIISEVSFTDIQSPEIREFDLIRGIKSSITEWPWRYLESNKGDRELYNVETDPQERINLALEHPVRTAELEKVLTDYLACRPHAPEPEPIFTEMSPEYREELETLGYIN